METIYSNNDWRSYSLAHSGRLGQKWGVKHGPPYPLGERQLTGAYRKNGGVSKSAAERDGVRPGAGSTNGRTTKGGYPWSHERARDKILKDGEKARKEVEKLSKKIGDSDKPQGKSLLDKMKAAKANRDAAKLKKEETKIAAAEAAAKAKKDADRLANLEKARAQKAEKKRLAEEYEKEQKDFQERAQKAIDEGDKEWAMENFSKLTNRQIDDVIKRADLNMKLDAAGPKEKDGWDKMDEFVKKVGKVRDWVNDGTKTWNTIAKINNSINPNLELPVIRDPFNNQNQGPDAKEKARREKVDKAIRSGDPKKIAAVLPEMKSNEVEEANKRINNEVNINRAANSKQAERQAKKEEKKNEQQAKADNKAREKEQQRKDKVRAAIDSGDISRIEKELSNMNAEEMKEAVERMSYIETIKNMAKNKKP